MEIKDYNVAIDSRNFFDQQIKNDSIYDNIIKTEIGLGDDYITGCLLDYPCFKNYYKLIAIDLSKQQKLDVDSKAIQQINFKGNLARQKGGRIYSIIEEVKDLDLVLDFSKGTS